MTFSEKPDFSEKSGFLNTRKFLFAYLYVKKNGKNSVLQEIF